MKTLPIFLLSGMFLFLAHTTTTACSLSPTAKIVTDPDGTVFYHNEAVILDGTTSTANCGSINQYRWQVDDVTVSWDAVYSHTFNLASGESERLFKVQLRVRNSAGKYGYKTIYVTVTRNNKSLYYLTDHLGSVRVTVNEQGDPVGWDDYYPFGLQMPGRTQNASNPNDDAKFTGYELEQQGDLGIYYAMARSYDPVIGRFMSVDPILSEFSSNKLLEFQNGRLLSYSPYNYTYNNPLIYTDPDGKMPLAIPIVIGGAKLYAMLKATVVTATVATGAYTAYNVYDNVTNETTHGIPMDDLSTQTVQPDPGSPFESSTRNPKNHDAGKSTSPPPGGNKSGKLGQIVFGSGAIGAFLGGIEKTMNAVADIVNNNSNNSERNINLGPQDSAAPADATNVVNALQPVVEKDDEKK